MYNTNKVKASSVFNGFDVKATATATAALCVVTAMWAASSTWGCRGG